MRSEDTGTEIHSTLIPSTVNLVRAPWERGTGVLVSQLLSEEEPPDGDAA